MEINLKQLTNVLCLLGYVVSFPVNLSERSQPPLSLTTAPVQMAAITEQQAFQQLIQTAKQQHLHQRAIGEIMQAIASPLLGRTYQAGMLDRSQQEKLIVSLTRFDCLLLVETVLALSRGIARQDYSYTTFVNHLQDLRYRAGKLDGYCSRLHYFSEWILDNQKRGTVRDLTMELGGIAQAKPLNFMSQHRDSYPQMSDPAIYDCIQQVEAQLQPFTFHYIPTDRIQQIYPRLHPGDIIAIATDIPGLDVTHTGIAYRQADDSFGLLHASPSGTVKISPDLQSYVARVDHSIGIMVARPN
ncbi:MAG TPA: N-acetylmuramoyl-L-alanine amidase-like domain-containing protein [Microcoleaceae cyanobacterium]|jgi:hypothetical protein